MSREIEQIQSDIAAAQQAIYQSQKQIAELMAELNDALNPKNISLVPDSVSQNVSESDAIDPVIDCVNIGSGTIRMTVSFMDDETNRRDVTFDVSESEFEKLLTIFNR